MNEEGLWEKFTQSANIKGVLRRSVHPARFGLLRGAGDFKRRGGPSGLSSEIHAFELSAMAHNQLINTLADDGEKFFALDEICTELAAFSTDTSALITDGGVDRKRPQPI